MAVALVVTVPTVIYSYTHCDLRPARVLLLLWLLVPPLWFNFEYHFFFKHDRCKEKCFEVFKHNQHLAGAMWVGIAASLGFWLSSASS